MYIDIAYKKNMYIDICGSDICASALELYLLRHYVCVYPMPSGQRLIRKMYIDICGSALVSVQVH